MSARFRRWGVAVLIVLSFSSCGDDNPAAGDLAATCAAAPSSGLAPLSVAFTLSVTGSGTGSPTVAVNYGDGTAGNDPSVPHTYTRAGSFTATFSVSSSGRSASCNTTVNVTAPAAVVPTGNQPPNAVFKTSPIANAGKITGPAPLAVQFNMCPTTDPDGDRRRFTMDFTTDGQLEVDGTTGADCRRGTTYPQGHYRARVCVTDLDGGLAPIHPFQCENYTVDSTP